VLGRGENCRWGCKAQAVSYIHAEGYPASEMKHGPIALIDADMPVVVIAPKDAVYDKVRSNIDEVKARGGCIHELIDIVDHAITIPRTHDALTPILASVPLQLLAYYIAVLRWTNVDRPRPIRGVVRCLSSRRPGRGGPGTTVTSARFRPPAMSLAPGWFIADP